LQIAKHNESIENLKVEIDLLNEAVETRTSAAKEGLLRYRELKHEAALALQEVATGFQNAQSLYRRGDKLMENLKAVKAEHDSLCKEVLQAARSEPDKAEPLLARLKESRRQLHKLYDEIENLRKEYIAADCEGSFGMTELRSGLISNTM